MRWGEVASSGSHNQPITDRIQKCLAVHAPSAFHMLDEDRSRKEEGVNRLAHQRPNRHSTGPQRSACLASPPRPSCCDLARADAGSPHRRSVELRPLQFGLSSIAQPQMSGPVGNNLLPLVFSTWNPLWMHLLRRTGGFRRRKPHRIMLGQARSLIRCRVPSRFEDRSGDPPCRPIFRWR